MQKLDLSGRLAN
jgi:ribonuclease HI